MTGIDVSELKEMQVAMEVRKNKLRKLFVRFRERLFQRLGEFAKEAKAAGLRGVEFVYRKSDRAVVQTGLVLNGYPLLIVGADEALPLELDNEELAFKLFIYPDNQDSNVRPWVEVTVFEAGNEQYDFKVEHPTETEIHSILHGSSVNRDEGIKVANAIISFFYHFKRAWTKKPTLESLLGGKTSSQYVAF
jgi:hypothetical protein